MKTVLRRPERLVVAPQTLARKTERRETRRWHARGAFILRRMPRTPGFRRCGSVALLEATSFPNAWGIPLAIDGVELLCEIFFFGVPLLFEETRLVQGSACWSLDIP